MSRLGSLDNPDFALIDLDPTEGCPYEKIVEAAQLVKKTLDSIGMAGYPKTTGGDGMHIYIPLDPIYTYEQVRSLAEILSILVIRRNPDLFTTPRTVSRRKRRKFISTIYRYPAPRPSPLPMCRARIRALRFRHRSIGPK